MGYHRAGFEVVGVDIEPQPNYPFELHQADALEFPLDGFDVVHASPPCQAFTAYRNNSAQTFRPAFNLIPATRAKLVEAELPYVIENVPGAPLHAPATYCGTSFPPLEVRRHRLFESDLPLSAPSCDHGRLTERKYPGSTNRPNGRTVCNIGEYRVPVVVQRRAIGIDWMSLPELSQAIPPAYTEHIGRQLMTHLEAGVAA